jgi:hypothetical protein
MVVGMDHRSNIPDAVPKASSDPLPEISATLFRRSQSRHPLESYITGLLIDWVCPVPTDRLPLSHSASSQSNLFVL